MPYRQKRLAAKTINYSCHQKYVTDVKKEKSKRLPFPPSTSRAKHVLNLVHSDLDEMSSASINGYIYTATYLNNHSRYGMMFFLKSEQFGAFKAYKAWAERHTDKQLKCI